MVEIAHEMGYPDDAPTPENITGINLSQQFEHLDEDTRKEIFPDVLRAMYHSSAVGLTPEQLDSRKSVLEELLRETESEITRVERRVEPRDDGHDR